MITSKQICPNLISITKSSTSLGSSTPVLSQLHICHQRALTCFILCSDTQLAVVLWWKKIILTETVPNEVCGLSWVTVSQFKLPLYQHLLRRTHCNKSDTFWPYSVFQAEDNHPLIKKLKIVLIKTQTLSVLNIKALEIQLSSRCGFVVCLRL